ncbi:MAG: LytR C-terminal domain-containing protein [bacterium]|nr:LytR C-terminal domain-containing protein [bacterium]
MLYIYLDIDEIKAMHLNKSLLGSYESHFHSKSLGVKLLEDGKPSNPDIIASAVKETVERLSAKGSMKEKNCTLILPQESFSFFRLDMPVDVNESVLDSYLREKARSILNIDIDNSHYDYIIRESEGKKMILFYLVHRAVIDAFEQPLDLLDLKLTAVVPASLAYFKLFEKTLRANKKENIWYVSYANDRLSGYMYDSFGLFDSEHWTEKIGKDDKIEKILHKQAAHYEAKGNRLNRLLLSGAQSAKIRQDTFTKDVGVWTNPVKKIIPHFYADYLKMLAGPENKELPILEYDMLLGGFIFTQEETKFTLLKGKRGGSAKVNLNGPRFSLPKISISFPINKKGLIIFILSFILTFGVLFGLAKMGTIQLGFTLPSFSSIRLPSFSKPTPTPEPIPTKAPTPTPAPEIKRDGISVKVLNGSGVSGKAGVVKSFLQEAGYESILTANADAFDFEVTVIQTKKDGDDLKKLMAKDIASELEGEVEFETLNEDDAADIIIIVGTDFR